MNNKPTFCIDCANFIDEGLTAAPWSGQFCIASLRTPAQDPVTGEKGFLATNSLGTRLVVREKYHLARDINVDGQCSKYSRKNKLVAHHE